MHYRAFITALPLAAALVGAVALNAPASATPMTGNPAAEQPAADGPSAVTATWLYRIEADWVRMHTRPTTRSTTKALARKWDESALMPQRAPQSNGFTLVSDSNNGVTGWVQTSYVEELFCLNGECE